MIYRNGNAAPVFWCPACPNAFRSSHQLWLNTCFCGGTKRTNPICISDILNITQSPDITGWAFSVGWNSKTYFSNLWTDYKSKLRPAHNEIYISAKKKKTRKKKTWRWRRLSQLHAHTTLNALVCSLYLTNTLWCLLIDSLMCHIVVHSEILIHFFCVWWWCVTYIFIWSEANGSTQPALC